MLSQQRNSQEYSRKSSTDHSWNSKSSKGPNALTWTTTDTTLTSSLRTLSIIPSLLYHLKTSYIIKNNTTNTHITQFEQKEKWLTRWNTALKSISITVIHLPLSRATWFAQTISNKVSQVDSSLRQKPPTHKLRREYRRNGYRFNIRQ